MGIAENEQIVWSLGFNVTGIKNIYVRLHDITHMKFVKCQVKQLSHYGE